MENLPNQTGQTDSLARDAQSCKPTAKWAALIDDTLVPAPQREVRASVLLEQVAAAPNTALVRDTGGEEDVAIGHDELVDLAKGNVFYLVPNCDAPPKCHCTKPPKLALFVDDRPEITLNPNQTGKSIRELFSLADDVNLVRDYESPHDEPVGLEDRAPFEKGPVFITRRQHAKLSITVNNKRFTEAEGVKHQMTGRQIAALVSDSPDNTEVFRLKKGESEPVPLNKEIHVENCDVFRVIRNNVAGGFEPSRIQRELEILKHGGCRADFIEQPIVAVIYRDVPTRPGYKHLQMTDVLVIVPGGYPGQPLDGAHLPEGSPLLGRVAGSPQGVVAADGRRWQLVSYHPHNGGGGPPWNKDKHGLHTYFDEILCWIHRANN
ncbi:MAG: hypothetical protein ABSA97_06640 [Verrucomicrobiia bacterium]